MLLFFSIDSSKPSASYKDSISVDDSYKAIVPVKHNGRVCFFYLTDRSFSNWYSDDETPPSGYYYGFVDPDSGKVFADKLFISDDDARKVGMTAFHMLQIQHLNQAKKWYITIPSQFILEIDPQTLTLKGCLKDYLRQEEKQCQVVSHQ